MTLRWLRACVFTMTALSLGCGEDDSDEASPLPPSGSAAGTGASPTSSGTGASGGDPSGGGAGGGGAGEGGSTDPCAGRILCEDFESHALGMPPAAPWQSATNNGETAVDGTHVHSGARAVRVATGAGQYKQALFFVEGAPTFPVPANAFYGRMMFYMEQAANDGVHWTMIQGSGPLAGQDGVTAHYRYGGMWQGKMMANYETWGLATDCWHNTETVMPTGVWTCMEWRFDGATDEMRFWLDGVEVDALHVLGQGMGCGGHDLDDQWSAPTFDRLWLGWESYQEDDPREAWIDDVIVDDEPIGCPR
jgi:hypothetical protein